MKRPLKWILAAFAAGISTGASAQTVTFNFDNSPAHTGLPLDVTSGKLSAHLTCTGYGFSIQQAGVLGFTPAGFSGNCIYPDSVFPADLIVSFSTDISDFSIMYSPEEYGCDSSATMRVTAYEDGVAIGTATTRAPNPGTWPTGTLKFNNGKPFDVVVIHYDKPPVTGGDWGPIFMADNMKATISTIPQADDDSYSTPVNTSISVAASNGVLANDEALAGAIAVLVTPTSNGTVTLHTDGSFSYIPNPGFVGTDTFTYKDSLGGVTSNVATVSLAVNPVLSGLTLSANAAISGSALSGTVTLSVPAPTGGTTVSLGTNLAGTIVPSSVKVPAGKSVATFKFTAGSVTTATAGLVTASFDGKTKSAPLSIYPPSKLSGISLSPSSVMGGKSAKCTITLAAAVPVGSQVVSLSTGSSILSCPATVTITAGNSSASFTVKSIPVSTSTTATVSATLNGAKVTGTLNVTIPPVSSVTLAPASVTGGGASTMTVTLLGAAGPNGAVVQLNSTSTFATVGGTVTLPAGAKTASVLVTTTAVAKKTLAKLTATYGGVSKSKTLTIIP